MLPMFLWVKPTTLALTPSWEHFGFNKALTSGLLVFFAAN